METFRVARMSPLILGLTLMLLSMPVVFFGIAIFFATPAAPVLLAAGAFVTAIYLWIGLVMRPARYELEAGELSLVSPLRRLRIPLHDVAGGRVLELSAFREEFGNMMRIGAGGLFGTFGWLWNRRSGRIDCYVTNLGPWVLVERRTGRPVLLSPAEPERFAHALGE